MKEWLTVKEAALVVGRHTSRIYRWIDNGTLASRVDVSGVVLVAASDVLKVEAVTKRGRPKGTASRNR